MTDHKFTDEEIIKALECCTLGDCFPCAYGNIGVGCRDKMNADALDLIKRQKAEIEELREIIFTDRSEAIKNLKAEAIKEFAERLKGKAEFTTIAGYRDYGRLINNLVKEMTEEQK